MHQNLFQTINARILGLMLGASVFSLGFGSCQAGSGSNEPTDVLSGIRQVLQVSPDIGIGVDQPEVPEPQCIRVSYDQIQCSI